MRQSFFRLLAIAVVAVASPLSPAAIAPLTPRDEAGAAVTDKSILYECSTCSTQDHILSCQCTVQGQSRRLTTDLNNCLGSPNGKLVWKTGGRYWDNCFSGSINADFDYYASCYDFDHKERISGVSLGIITVSASGQLVCPQR